VLCADAAAAAGLAVFAVAASAVIGVEIAHLEEDLGGLPDPAEVVVVRSYCSGEVS